MKLIDSILRQPARVAFGRSSSTADGTINPVALDSTRDSDSVTITADDGSFVVIPGASGTTAGILTASDKVALDGAAGVPVHQYVSKAAVEAASVPTSQGFLRTAGFHAPGDGGGALYVRVDPEPAHAGKIQSADGTWWELVIAAGWINVRWLGAAGDGATNDTAAVQAAAGMIPASGGTLHFPPGTYLLTQVDLPLDREVGLIGGPGAIVKTASALPAISRYPADQTEANAAQSKAVHVAGLKFEGDGTAGQKGLRIAATYGATVRDCHFGGLDTGLELLFALMTRVEACRATNCWTDGFVARHGDWPGAGTSNSQSNHTRFVQCRNFARAGMNSAFRIRAASGVVVEGCIAEGNDPVYNIHFTDEGATVVKEFTVENLHVENAPTGASLLIDGQGETTIRGIYFQTAHTLIDLTGYGSGSGNQVYISNIPNWPAGSKMTHADCGINFFGLIGDKNPVTDTAFWGNAPPPPAEEDWTEPLDSASAVTDWADGTYTTKEEASDESTGRAYDMRGTTWVQQSDLSHWQFRISGSFADMAIVGGYATCDLSWHPIDCSWDTSKNGGTGSNRTSLESYSPGTTTSGVHVWNHHDAFRSGGPDGDNFVIQHCWADYIRDDFLENDNEFSGTVFDCLIDGAYGGFSTQGVTDIGQTLTLDKVLLRMEPMPSPFDPNNDIGPLDGHSEPFGHGNIFKQPTGNFVIKNTIFMAEYDNGGDYYPAPGQVTEFTNNTFLFPGGGGSALVTQLSSDFPTLTIVTDEATCRQIWGDAVLDWHARHPNVGNERAGADKSGSILWPRFGQATVDYTHVPSGGGPGTLPPYVRTIRTAGGGGANLDVAYEGSRFHLNDGFSGRGIVRIQTFKETVDIGSIAAGATVEVTVFATGLVSALDCAVFASPRNSLEGGLVWSAYKDSGAIKLRVHNTTGAAIDPGSKAWIFVVTQI